MDYIKLMRVHHYIKNLLVFAALACSGQFFQTDRLFSALAGFGAFCMVSSVVYIVNDIRDREKDRLHPSKRGRPIAAGKVSEQSAWILAAVLAGGGAACNALVFRPLSSLLLALYLALNLAYSFGLKHVPLLDVTILTSGFLLRMIYGAIVTQVDISNWLYLTVIALAFYFSLGKRRNEIVRLSDKGEARPVLRHYTVGFLEKNMYMCLSLGNVFYALWCMDEDTVSRYGVSLVFTVPLVLLICMKYSMDIEGDSDGDPVEVLLHDWALLVLCLVYFSTMFTILYF